MSEHKSRRAFIKQLSFGAAASPLVLFGAVQKDFTEWLKEIPASDFTRFKSHYLLAEHITYLNHASIGTIPSVVHQTHEELLKICETNPWQYMWGGKWEDPREETRTKAARFIGAEPEEIALTHNTTELFNMLAMGLPLGKGDEVLFSNLNHDGAGIPFEFHASRKGYKVKKFSIPIDKIEALSAEEITDLHLRQISPKTKLIVLPHIDNMIGLRTPVRAIASEARAIGVEWIALDTAQSMGMVPVQTEDLGVDVIGTSTHKWIQSPKGISISYLSKPVQEVLKPSWVTWGQTRWQGTVRRFEDYGTRNLAEAVTLGHAFDFQANIDMSEREDHLKKLWKKAQQLTDNHPKTTWRSSRDWELSGSLYAIEIKGEKASELAKRLFTRHGFVFRPFDNPGLNTIRLSPNLVNTEAELVKLFELI